MLQASTKKLIDAIESGKVLIHFDETNFNSTTGREYSWAKKGSEPGRLYKKPVRSISMFLAVLSTGDWFAMYMDSCNNQWTTIHFLVNLFYKLDQVKPLWRKNHLLCLDECPAHTAQTTRWVINYYEVSNFLLAPAIYLGLPEEQYFAAIKAKRIRLDEPLIWDNEANNLNVRLSNQ